MLNTKKALGTAILSAVACLGLAAWEAQAQVIINRPPNWSPQQIVNAQAQQFLLGYQFQRALYGPFASHLPQQFNGPWTQGGLQSYNNSISPLSMVFPGFPSSPAANNNNYNPYLNPAVWNATQPLLNSYMNSNPYLTTPYSYGNPYAGGGPMNVPIYSNPYASATAMASPYSTGGYGSTYSTGMVSPYSSMGVGGYSPYMSMGGYGSMYSPMAGYGTAAVMQGQGQLMLNSEMARSMREQANQAKIKTKKEEFDFELYKKEKTPTFTEEQQKIAQNTLKRIQTTATMGEILSGKALNVLLRDLGTHKDRKVAPNPIQLDEEVLKQLNVTLPNGGNLGLLRNEGQFTWPAALTEVVPGETRKSLQEISEMLYRQALNNKVAPNVLRDLEAGVEKITDSLRNKVNEVPVGQYLEAKRFLNDFQDAIRALRTPNVVPQVVAYRTWAAGGKTALELTDYMLNRGLIFASAVHGDEAAYQAAHTALANLDIAVNALVTASR